MVTRRALEKYMCEVTEIAEETRLKPKEVEQVLKAVQNRIENNKRQPKEPAPEGGISIREAARKYGILHCTISRWVNRGKIPILKITKNWKYIHEPTLAKLVVDYLKNPGKGKRTIN